MPAQVSATGLAAEDLLLRQFHQDDLYGQCRALGALHQLYFSHRNAGGREGMIWVKATQSSLIESIETDRRHQEFIRFREDAAAFIRFPPEIKPPPTLNFSEEWGRPDIIPVENGESFDPLQRPLAYFLLSSLRFLESEVPWDKIAAEQGKRKGWHPITVAYHPSGTRLWAVEALAASLAAYFSGNPYILGRITQNSLGTRGRLIREILESRRQATQNPAPLVPIATEFAFTPRYDPDFAPLLVTLTRQQRPCPVVIERFYPEEADRLPPDLKAETLRRWQEKKGTGVVPFFRALRTLEGDYQAMSLSFLVREGRETRMACERAVLRDLDKRTKIEGAGLAFLVSALRYMKTAGYWPNSGPILFNFIPDVLNAYRKRAGLSVSAGYSFSVALDSVGPREGEEFLNLSPLKFEELMSAPPPATSKAVLLDGGPAG